MPRVLLPGLRWLHLLAVAKLVVGCSSAATERAAETKPLVMSAAESYELLNALPKTGSGSLAAIYTEMSTMSFGQFYTYLHSNAVDADVVVDGYPVPNQKILIESLEDLFMSTGHSYATVGDWWQAGGGVAALGSYSDYKAALDKAFGPSSPSRWLGLVGGACGGPRGAVVEGLSRMLPYFVAHFSTVGRSTTLQRQLSSAANGNLNAALAAAPRVEGAVVEPVAGATDAARNARNSRQPVQHYDGWTFVDRVQMITTLDNSDSYNQPPVEVTPGLGPTTARNTGYWQQDAGTCPADPGLK